MSFNAEKVVRDMIDAMQDTVGKEVPGIGQYGRQILEKQKASLAELAQARLTGEIDDRIFERELKRERTVAETELLAVKIMTKATAQRALNAAIGVLRDAVKAALAAL